MTTMIGPLRRAVQVAPDAVAARCGDIEITYGQMWERARRLVGALRELGVRDGDRVAVVGRNCHRYLELYQAIPGAGMVLVPLNQRHTAAELAYALRDSGSRVLFAASGIDCPSGVVEHVIDLDDGYEALLAAAPAPEFPDELAPPTMAGLFYTGGTTGASKGVILTHGNLVANAFHFQAQFAFRPETCWLVAAPLFHAAGSIAVLPTVWHGGRQVMLPVFDPVAALDLIETQRVTATLLVPTMLAALAEEQLARPRDVSSLRLLSHGGSPVATETLRRARQAFPEAELMHLYGTTETAPIATIMAHEETLLDTPQARSCGQPAIGVEVRVLDEQTDGTAAPGVVGEVLIRGENVMAGYWNKPDDTAVAMLDGWYRTGDLGYVDERSFLYLVDRAKDMIVSGGENVYSTEVEDVLYRHPAVLEAAVFGIPDARWGEAVHAVVVPRGEVAEADLLAHCRGAIADYKIPKRIELSTEPLPKSGAGKVLKRELRAPYWTGHESVVGGA
ncbi:MAG TPA: AMP-binding protein [Solirubrobacteraceae bacterium]|jgi:long-chain acyl-CoA synthetase|nr:AMP-binding protein [Solirubrobacteraceae bacterium]